MIVGHFLLDVNEANAYILACEDTREAALIDAGTCDARFEPFCTEHGLNLTKIFITHDHFDHTGGLSEALRLFGAEAYSLSGSVGGVTTHTLKPGDAVTVGKLEGRVVHTPGHTPDGISLIFDGVVFSGDALFCGSVGGTASQAQYEQQLDAIRKELFTLPGDYEVFSGHGPATTIGIEQQYGPFFI